MGGVLQYTNGRCTVGFPFLQGLQGREAQRYKRGGRTAVQSGGALRQSLRDQYQSRWPATEYRFRPPEALPWKIRKNSRKIGNWDHFPIFSYFGLFFSIFQGRASGGRNLYFPIFSYVGLEARNLFCSRPTGLQGLELSDSRGWGF